MPQAGGATPAVWQVGALCRALADALDARFNPVRVVGEVSGFARAASGHCYFVLKDGSGQLRCAMFRRAATLLGSLPRDGDRVEVLGRLGVYEPRGELQLVVESLRQAGQGQLLEEFLARKQRLEREGLFDPDRKKPLPAMPRGIAVVTSLGAAALHDVVTALQRRAPHVPVVLAPALVQGEQAAPTLVQALRTLYQHVSQGTLGQPVDAILLVRGGGSMEDLWAFNDEQLARTIAQSPVPVISGVGHETDFTIADFVADLRAPTPTAAAELVCPSLQSSLQALAEVRSRLVRAAQRSLERRAQQLDRLAGRLDRQGLSTERQRARLDGLARRWQHGVALRLQAAWHAWERAARALPQAVRQDIAQRQAHCAQLQWRLQALDPERVLSRGYAWLHDGAGQPITSVAQVQVGEVVAARLADGTLDLALRSKHHN